MLRIIGVLHRGSFRAPYSLLSVMLMLVGAPLPAGAAALGGWVQSGETPIVFSTVTLYNAGRHRGRSVKILGTATTDESGYFRIFYKRPRRANRLLYLVAEGGIAAAARADGGLSRRRYWQRHRRHNKSPIRFATVLGKRKISGNIVLNERTTVATAYTMAQFIDDTDIKGRGPGPRNAAEIIRNLINVHTGAAAAFIQTGANTPGDTSSTLWTFNSLANLLALCVNDEVECPSLFDATTPPGGKAPRHTLQAVVNIVHYPSWNAAQILDLSRMQTTYKPALAADAVVDAWTLALRYVGNGVELDGPGFIVFDKDGNAWINNNYQYNASDGEDVVVCGDDHVMKFTPTGEDFPGAPYGGPFKAGGLYGSGLGINLDPKSNVWVSNFGFQGSNCPNDKPTLAVSISKFNADGEPLSPEGDPPNNVPGGFQGRGMHIEEPQGTASDRKGSIWIANCGGRSVVKFPRGNPRRAKNFAFTDPIDESDMIQKPFGIAIDTKGRAWVASNANDSVIGLNRDGSLFRALQHGVAGIIKPMGVATDSLGNVWVANSGVVRPPCENQPGENTLFETVQELLELGPDFQGENASITLIRRNGKPSKRSPYKGGGLLVPWGIAVDGNDNVWVANFDGQRLSHLCGARPWTCPPGHRTGDPISPDSGYSFNGLVRNTGVSIDPSGNVWLANNWQIHPKLTNPGGHQVVVFLGLAKPVKTPLIGAPRHTGRKRFRRRDPSKT